MIGVDTNILVYAHREDSPHHRAARTALAELVESDRSWAVPWACVHEFLAVVTHPRIYMTPTTTGGALEAIGTLLAEGGGRTLGEPDDHLERLGGLLRTGGVVGARIHDARVAAICLAHGVSELWTADRDFSYFPVLRTRNPLVTSA